MIRLDRQGAVAELKIQHANELNLFSVAMTRQLIGLCEEIEADETIAGVLVWGGEGRSFSAGGDFNDLRQFKTRSKSDVAAYLRDIVASYQAVLRITKPVVAAIDLHAIGQGLQVALMCDWRVGSERSRYHMPELANGVPCPLGSAILEALYGRAVMLQLVVGCEQLDAGRAQRYRLIDEVCAHPALKPTALERLSTFCRYPTLPYRLTKRIHNARMIQHLESVNEAAAQAHATSFFSGQADQHFSRILGEGS